jgi:hypothetical protein
MCFVVMTGTAETSGCAVEQRALSLRYKDERSVLCGETFAVCCEHQRKLKHVVHIVTTVL